MPLAESFMQSHLNGSVGSSFSQNTQSKYEICIFDLDDTLYPLSSGLAPACRSNIIEFMVKHLGFGEAEAEKKCLEYYYSHGTTMAGLRANGYDFDFDKFHEFVHGRLPYHQLKPDPVLRSLLLSMSQRKYVFTNGDKIHAEKCLKLLGIEDCFDKVICFETIMEYPPILPYSLSSFSFSSSLSSYSSPHSGSSSISLHSASLGNSSLSSALSVSFSHSPAHAVEASKNAFEVMNFTETEVTSSWMGESGPLICCKPQIESFHRTLRILNADPAKTVFFDDSTRNIAAAKEVGLTTVLVGSSARCQGCDVAVTNLHNLKSALPDLWEKSDQFDDMLCPSSSVIEYVRA